MRKLIEKLKHLLGNFWTALFVMFAVLGIMFYLILGRGATTALVEQMLHRQQLSARSAARALEVFISHVGRSIVILSKTGNLSTFNSSSEEILHNFTDGWKGTPVIGAILVDKEGLVRLVSDQNATSVGRLGVSVSDRFYFQRAKEMTEEGVVIGVPVIPRLGERRDEYILPVVTPLFDNGEFAGVFVVAINLRILAEQYIYPLKSSENIRTFLVTNEGVVLHSPRADLVGVNYFDYIEQNPFLGSDFILSQLKASLPAKDEGKFDLVLPTLEKDGLLTRYLIAYSPLWEGERGWILAMAAPVEEVFAFRGPYYFRIFSVFTITFLVLLAFFMRFAKAQGYKEGVEEEHEKHGIAKVTN